MNAIAKMTPRGSSASYYAAHNVITSSAAAMGSVTGGVLLSLLSSNAGVSIGSAGAYDILFILSALLSITAAKLRLFREEGESTQDIVKKEMRHAVYNDIRMAVSHIQLSPLSRLNNTLVVLLDLLQKLPPAESPRIGQKRRSSGSNALFNETLCISPQSRLN